MDAEYFCILRLLSNAGVPGAVPSSPRPSCSGPICFDLQPVSLSPLPPPSCYRVMQASMAGDNITVLWENLTHPISITALSLDRRLRLLFWLEGEREVRYWDLAPPPGRRGGGPGRVPLGNATRPAAIAVHKGRLYYADAETGTVASVEQLTGTEKRLLRNGTGGRRAGWGRGRSGVMGSVEGGGRESVGADGEGKSAMVTHDGQIWRVRTVCFGQYGIAWLYVFESMFVKSNFPDFQSLPPNLRLTHRR